MSRRDVQESGGGIGCRGITNVTPSPSAKESKEFPSAVTLLSCPGTLGFHDSMGFDFALKQKSVPWNFAEI
jgi:hypothetical protein